MKPYIVLTIIFLNTLFSCQKKEQKIITPLIITSHTTLSFICTIDDTNNTLILIDKKTGNEIDKIALPEAPSGLIINSDGDKAYITTKGSKSKLLEIDLSNRAVTRLLEVGHYAISPVINKDKLYFLNRFEAQINQVDLDEWKITNRCATLREPSAIDVVNENILITHLLPTFSQNHDYNSSCVSVFNKQLEQINTIFLPKGANGARKISHSADEHYAYIPHIYARYWLPTNQIERGWINTNALSIIDLKKLQLKATVLLDDLDKGAANPFDAKCSSDGKWLIVSHLGTDEVSLINRKQLHHKIETRPCEIAVENDLTFMHHIRRRLKLKGRGPKSIWINENEVYIGLYYSGHIEMIDIDHPRKSTILKWHQQDELTPDLKGEMYFNDATICKQQWHSCASCHPGEGRADGLNWDNLNDGLGNPKNTKSLLFSHQTPPAMATGIRPDAEGAVRAGLHHILFAQLHDSIAQYIDQYLLSLRPIKSPFLNNGKLSAKAEKGKVLFKAAKCNQCHSGTYFTDMKIHSIQTSLSLAKDSLFDTPTLIEIWRTAPYLHHGEAKSIEEIFTKFNSSDTHGLTKKLTEEEIGQLSEFIRSL